MRVRLGICGSLDEDHVAGEAGFDYVEVGLAQLVQNPRLDDRVLPLYATNLFFPGDIRLFAAPQGDWLVYAKHALLLASGCGASVCVIGSGGQRRAPEPEGTSGREAPVSRQTDGDSVREATPADTQGTGADSLRSAERGLGGWERGGEKNEWDARFADIVGEIERHAKAAGIRVAPESLNRTESNVGNDLGSLARLLRARGVGYTADLYHLLFEFFADHPEADAPTPEWWLEQLPYAPTHVHIADRARHSPHPEDPLVRAFLNRLRELNYEGGISFEGARGAGFDELRSIRASLEALTHG